MEAQLVVKEFVRFSCNNLLLIAATSESRDYNKGFTTSSNIWDAPSYFICSNLEVISLLGRCDNSTDCSDGSDENNCRTESGKYIENTR